MTPVQPWLSPCQDFGLPASRSLLSLLSSSSHSLRAHTHSHTHTHIHRHTHAEVPERHRELTGGLLAIVEGTSLPPRLCIGAALPCSSRRSP